MPWVLLARRTAFQPDLDASAAELVMGANPAQPGDIIGEPGPPINDEQLRRLLEGLRTNAARPAIQTAHHRTPPVNVPINLDQVTHVRVKRAKPGPLGISYEGPFQIIERVGDSCLKLRVGSYASGEPRYELQHWENCKPAVMSDDTPTAVRQKLGRKALNPRAAPFKPVAPPPFQNVKDTGPPKIPFKKVDPLPPPENEPKVTDEKFSRTGRKITKPVRFQANSFS